MANPYETAIRITGDIKGFSAAMAIVSSLLTRTTSDVNRIKKGLESWNPAIAGATAAIGGMGLLKAIEGVERAGEKLVHAKVMFGAALPEHERAATLAQVTASAWTESSKNQRTVLSENVKMLKDLWTVTQDIQQSKIMLGPANLLKTTLASIGGVTGEEGDRKAFAAVRALDLAGRTTEKTLIPAMESLTRTAVALGDRFDIGSYLTQIQSAGPMRLGMSDKVLTEQFPILQVLGLGTRTGTGMYQLYRMWMGGGGALSSKQQLEAQEKYGLFSKEDEIRVAGGGGRMNFGRHLSIGSIGSVESSFKGFKAGSIFEAEKLYGPKSDLFQWAEDVRNKLLKPRGIDINDQDAMGKVIAEMARNNKLLAADLSELLIAVPHRQQLREQQLIDKMDPHVAQYINQNDPGAARSAFQAQLDNIQQAAGEYVVPTYMDTILKPITGLLNAVKELIHENPEQIKNWMLAISGIGASLVSLGTAALIGRFLPGGPFIVALGALGAALVAFGIIDPNKAKSAMLAITKDTGLFLEVMKGLSKDFAAWTKSLNGPESAREALKGVMGLNPRLRFGLESKTLPSEIHGPEDLERHRGQKELLYGRSYHPISGAFSDFPEMQGGRGSSSSVTKFIQEQARAIAKAIGEYFSVGTGTGGWPGLYSGGSGPHRGQRAILEGGVRDFLHPHYSGGTGRAHGQRSLLHGGVPAAHSAFGGGGWWTPDLQAYAFDYLTKNGVSALGAQGLIARWRDVESTGSGINASNSIGGGHWGIAQWGTARGGRNVPGTSLDQQLAKVVGELRGPEARAAGILNKAKTAWEAAQGASAYERAEGWNWNTLTDNFTSKTARGVGAIKSAIVSGLSAKAATALPHHLSVAEIGAWDQHAKHRDVFGHRRPVGSPPRAGGQQSQSHVYLDGRIVGELVENRITRRHLHTHGPGGHDGRRGLTPVDAWSVA